jgi:Mediator of CRAC channel activity
MHFLDWNIFLNFMDFKMFYCLQIYRFMAGFAVVIRDLCDNWNLPNLKKNYLKLLLGGNGWTTDKWRCRTYSFDLICSYHSPSRRYCLAANSLMPVFLTLLFNVGIGYLGTSMLAIIISTCILPHISAVAKLSQIKQVNQSPHDKMTFLVDLAWVLSNSASLFFFTLGIHKLFEYQSLKSFL